MSSRMVWKANCSSPSSWELPSSDSSDPVLAASDYPDVLDLLVVAEGEGVAIVLVSALPDHEVSLLQLEPLQDVVD